MRSQRQVVVNQMYPAAFKTAADVGNGNVMSAHANALTHAGHCLRRTGKPEVMQLDFISQLAGAPKEAQVSYATQRGFQCKCFLLAQTLLDLSQQQTSCLYGTQAGFQRRQTTGKFIRIEKAQAFDLFWQELPSKRSFARTVATGDQINRWRSFRHLFSVRMTRNCFLGISRFIPFAPPWPRCPLG